MLTAAKRKEFQVLIIDDLSRLHRDAGEQDRTLKRLRIFGVRVISVADGWDSAVPGAKLTAAFKGILNEQYLETLADHTRSGANCPNGGANRC